MAVIGHVFPEAQQQLGTKAINLTSDTLAVLLISSASNVYTWGATPETHVHVSDFLGGDGTHGALTEVTGGSYSRQNLTGVSLATSGEVTTLTCSNPVWMTSTISAIYACFFDNTPVTDATRQLLCYFDFRS